MLYADILTFDIQRNRAEMADKKTAEKAIGEEIVNFTTRRGNRRIEK